MIDPERVLQPNAFAGDNGTVPASLAAALLVDDLGGRQEALAEALINSRVFVALSEPAEGEDEMRELRVEVAGLDALAVFSSAEKLAECAPGARPLPLLGRNAAAQAMMHSGLLALDPANPDGDEALYVGRSACAAIASGFEWTPPWKDDGVRERLRAAVGVVERCLDVWIRPAPGGAVLIALQMSETSERSDAERATAIVGHSLTHDEYLHARLDLVHIVPVRTA